MERTMSVEDKIRRAEEIYYRRRNQEMPVNENIKIPERKKKNFKLFKKMIKQIIICLIIYAIFFLITTNNYIFSEDFTAKMREILSQDIDLSYIYSTISNLINKIPQNTENPGGTENAEDANNADSQETTEQQPEDEKTKEEIQNNNENIGGAEVLETTEESATTEKEASREGTPQTQETPITEEQPQLSQMEQDANYIKSTINFIKPVGGTISSMFGLRNPTTASVPKNHTGTDIAAVTGTKIVSATDGTVIYTSTKGDFGKHLKIQVDDVIILYAHMNKIYVKEGDSIKQGQEIGEVGSTGNTTGPHLHFEIRYQDRCVDPQMILEL